MTFVQFTGPTTQVPSGPTKRFIGNNAPKYFSAILAKGTHLCRLFWHAKQIFVTMTANVLLEA